MSTLRLAGRIAALVVAVPAYYLAYLLLLETSPVGVVPTVDVFFPVSVFVVGGVASLVVALGATYVALAPAGLGARTVGISLGGLLLIVAIVALSTPLFASFLGLVVGAVGLLILFAGASVADARAA